MVIYRITVENIDYNLVWLTFPRMFDKDGQKIIYRVGKTLLEWETTPWKALMHWIRGYLTLSLVCTPPFPIASPATNEVSNYGQ